MATLFTKIIDGDIPGRFVWQDEVCVAFLTIEPLTPGHAMVVPRAEIAQWTEADDETWAHLQRVAKVVGQAQQAAWDAPRVGMLLEGYLVLHLHVHVWPTQTAEDFDPHAPMKDVSDEDFEAAAERLRDALRAAGHGTNVPGPGPLPR